MQESRPKLLHSVERRPELDVPGRNTESAGVRQLEFAHFPDSFWYNITDYVLHDTAV